MHAPSEREVRPRSPAHMLSLHAARRPTRRHRCVTEAVASWRPMRPMRPSSGHLLRLFLLQACDCGDEGGSARNEATCTELTKPLSAERSAASPSSRPPMTPGGGLCGVDVLLRGLCRVAARQIECGNLYRHRRSVAFPPRGRRTIRSPARELLTCPQGGRD